MPPRFPRLITHRGRCCAGWLGRRSLVRRRAPCRGIARRVPVTAKPNLNGIWQALNTANWNIEAHAAAPLA